MLTVQNLLKSFRGPDKSVIHAVDHLSFEVQAGEIYGLLGPNGAGKTTTLRILATLANADSGTILVNGVELAKDPLAIRRALAYVPAEAGLPERLTPLEVVRLFARIQAVPNPKARADELLEQLGAGSYREKPCGELSTGMKRRVVLARALVHAPKVLLLDEPTDGLDVSGRQDVLDLVKAQAQAGCAVVLSSHIMGEVEQIVNRIGVLHHGVLVAEGMMEDLLKQAQASSLNEAFLALTRESKK